MNSVFDTLPLLVARLPELEWKLQSLQVVLSKSKLPAGLFNQDQELSSQSVITEIKADLHTLSLQTNERSCNYLAERIGRKINVLVRLCQSHSHKKHPVTQQHFGVKLIGTRQQWLREVQEDIQRYTQQYQALTTTLASIAKHGNKEHCLSLQAELGEVERRLTLANETLARGLY